MGGLQRLPNLFAVAVEAGIIAAIRMTHQVVDPRFFPVFRGYVGIGVHNCTAENHRRKSRGNQALIGILPE
jgi:hypothetical protein